VELDFLEAAVPTFAAAHGDGQLRDDFEQFVRDIIQTAGRGSGNHTILAFRWEATEYQHALLYRQ
jgi:hypothetical protein